MRKAHFCWDWPAYFFCTHSHRKLTTFSPFWAGLSVTDAFLGPLYTRWGFEKTKPWEAPAAAGGWRLGSGCWPADGATQASVSAKHPWPPAPCTLVLSEERLKLGLSKLRMLKSTVTSEYFKLSYLWLVERLVRLGNRSLLFSYDRLFRSFFESSMLYRMSSLSSRNILHPNNPQDYGCSVVRNPFAKQETRLPCRRLRFNPWVGKIPWKRKWQPTPVLYGCTITFLLLAVDDHLGCL